jgi:hypothetical protein
VSDPLAQVVTRAERRRRRQQQSLVRWTIRIAIGLVVLLAGVALGEALHDNPSPGTPFTQTRTLPPPGPATGTG